MPSDAETPWQWWWGEGKQAERYHGPFDSRQEAIQEAMASDTDPDYAHITICEARKAVLRDDFFRADVIIDCFNEHNSDVSDPDGDYCIEDTTTEQDAELEGALQAAFAAWRTKHGIGNVWAFDDVRYDEVIALPVAADAAN